jgi:metal-sulfur cluster biosynthetic enzyme
MNPKKILEDQVIMVIKTVEDPEIPVNIYELGLIYFINITDPVSGPLTKHGKPDMRFTDNKGGIKKGYDVNVEMTLTSPNCPVAESLPEEVRTKVENLEMVNKSTITITFEPTWDSSYMSEEAKLELGML